MAPRGGFEPPFLGSEPSVLTVERARSLVKVNGIEPPSSPSQAERSTTELHPDKRKALPLLRSPISLLSGWGVHGR